MNNSDAIDIEKEAKKQINDILKMDIVKNIDLNNQRFKITTFNEVEAFFIKNYLENNVFGYNYTILDTSRNISRIIELDPNKLDIRIYNQMALMILFKHFNITWSDDYLNNNERDTDTDKYYNAPFIYIKDKTGLNSSSNNYKCE